MPSTVIRLNDYFDQLYLINLARRPQKLTRVLRQLDRYQIKVQVWSAVDGRHPDIFFQQQVISPGAYGYFLSWRQILQDATQHNYRRILILDDDVILHQNFNQHFDHWINSIPNWKVLLLGATQHTQRPALIPPNNNCYHPARIDGSFSVGLDSSIFSVLLTQLNQIDTPQLVDSQILRSIYRQYPEECLVAYPNLMIADVTQSDLQAPRSQEELAKKVGWSELTTHYHWPPDEPQLVSLIISCYQSEETIERCLESVLSQTYRPIELIITDDGSTDRTCELIGQTLNRWQYRPQIKGLTIKFQHLSRNKGSFVSRNRGLARATGQLITFQDADDISLDHRIETQVNQLMAHQVKFTCCLILRTHLKQLSRDLEQLQQDIERTRIHAHQYCCRTKVGLVTTMFRREIIEQLGAYPEVKWGGDALYLRKLFPQLDPNYKVMNYLNDLKYIPNLYYQVSEVLYLSHEMTERNLTSQRLRATKVQD